MHSAPAFVIERIVEFGLLGTNNVVPHDRHRDVLPACNQDFTKANHFRFGFDDTAFGNRLCSSATYWVEYGKVSRLHQGFWPEWRRALSDIYEANGRLSVSNTGTVIAQFVVAAAREIGLPLEQITIALEGHVTPPHDESLPNRRYSVTWDEFEDFAVSYADHYGCPDAWVALDAFHGSMSDAANIYSAAPIVLHNHNYNRLRGRSVGPANWSLVDH